MRSILALVLAVSLFVSPLAIAGGLSSTDSGFLFKGDQVSATTISTQEMQSTQGRQFEIFPAVGIISITTAGGTTVNVDNAPGQNLIAFIAAGLASLLQ